MANTTLLIRKRDNGEWEGIRKGSSRASFLENTKKEAVSEGGRYLADYDNVEEMVIYKSDGEVDDIKKAPRKTNSNEYKNEVVKKHRKRHGFVVSFLAWEEESLDGRLTDSDIGCRVHIAGEKNTVKSYLKDVHEPGDEYFPEGGYTVQSRNKDYTTDHGFDQVRLHEEEKRKRLRDI